MVSLNLTLLVLLAMFLGFLWAMQRFVFRPTLTLMDQREEQIAEGRDAAHRASHEAEALEDKYAAKIAAMHQEANLRLVRARRNAQDEHFARVEAFKKHAEEDLRALRRALREDVKSQLNQLEPCAGELAAVMAARLDLE